MKKWEEPIVKVLLDHFSKGGRVEVFREVHLNGGRVDLVLISKRDLSISLIEVKRTGKTVAYTGKTFGQILTYAALLTLKPKCFLKYIIEMSKSKPKSSVRITRDLSTRKRFYAKFYVAFRQKDYHRHIKPIALVRELLGKSIGIMAVDVLRRKVYKRKSAHKRFRIVV